MIIKKRNENLISFVSLLAIIGCIFIIYSIASDKKPGIGFNEAPLINRVSASYVFKNVNTPVQPIKPGLDGYENGASNIVTSIVVDYRGFDTLGEIVVLFISSLGVSLLLPKRKAVKLTSPSMIVSTAVPFISLIVIVVGVYVILHGHVSPGGGFSGGAIIASAFLIRYLGGHSLSKKSGFKTFEAAAGIIILAYGITGLMLRGSFLANFLYTGQIGKPISAIGIMIIYAMIGIKVASELGSISEDFFVQTNTFKIE